MRFFRRNRSIAYCLVLAIATVMLTFDYAWAPVRYRLGAGDEINLTAVTKINQGVGSGLDADKLDGKESTDFISSGAGGIKDTDIDFGLSAGQVNTDDVPEGTANKYFSGKGLKDLADTPGSYTGQSSKVVAVKSTEDGVEFVTNSGEANTASNVGTGGVGVFKQKVGADLEHKKINAENNKVNVADDVSNNEIDIGVNEANILHQNLSGAGTNTHAQIDAHISSTSNPHSVTAAQLGAEETANKDAANGYAGLDAIGKLAGTQIPYGTTAGTACEGNDSRLSGGDTSVIENNILVNAWRLATVGAHSFTRLVDGFADAFVDETGIDTTASINEIYDAGGDYYSPTISVYTQVTTTGKTYSADSVYSSNVAGNAWNDNTGNEWMAASTAPHWVKIDFGVGNSEMITKVSTHSDRGQDFRVEGSNNDSDWTDVSGTLNASTINAYVDNTFTNGTNYRYYRLYVTSVDGGTDWVEFNNIKMYEGQAEGNLTLISNAFTAQSTPTDARVILFEEDVDAVTLNTDLKAYASRDNGTTYTQITLTDKGNYESGKQILAGTVDISGQPTGMSMKYKVTTHNLKNLKVHGLGCTWN
ncbi:MAG: discoidin domain-containing protein [Planctomycetes bacterium]|nr:discoidin domain-containing protein [Planctomycetota bacterium]